MVQGESLMASGEWWLTRVAFVGSIGFLVPHSIENTESRPAGHHSEF